jgi:3-hydroxyacyl-[acyl-carrier-protein] dehydratase
MSTEIEALLPHRPPFLFVDAIISADESGTVAERTFTTDDFFFRGHFPEYPVVPGVILVETLAQAGGAGLRKTGALQANALFFLATIDKAKFRRQVRPGDTVRLEVKNLRVSTRMLKQSGRAFVGDECACEAEWMCIVGAQQPIV